MKLPSPLDSEDPLHTVSLIVRIPQEDESEAKAEESASAENAIFICYNYYVTVEANQTTVGEE